MKRTFLIFLAITLVLAVGVNVAFAQNTLQNDFVRVNTMASPTNTDGSDATQTPAPVPNENVSIDMHNVYQGMSTSYGVGYLPQIVGNIAQIRLPLQPVGWVPTAADYVLSVKLDLGGESSPFVVKNYDTPFNYSQQAVINPQGVSDVVNAWLVAFDLELKTNRNMGTYPVSINVSYMKNGVRESNTYVVQVAVDGKDPNATATPEPTLTPEPTKGPQSAPKVIISNYTISPEIVYAGEVFDVEVTLKNTNVKQGIQNIVVTYKGQTTDLLPESNQNTFFIDSIAPDASDTFNFKMTARADAKPGPQKIDIIVAFEDKNATALTAQDEVMVQIRQKIRLEYDDPKFQLDAMVGDNVPANLNLYNKGKNILYNVTVFLELPGFTPDSSAFLGNMDSGASKTAEIYATVSGETMGPVEGNFVVKYEDEYGDSYDLKIPITTTVMEMTMPDSPMVDIPEEEAPQGIAWWVYAIIAGGVAAAVIITIVILKKKKRHKELQEEIDEDELY